MATQKRCLNCLNIKKSKEQIPCRQCYEYDKWEQLYSKAEIMEILSQAVVDDGTPMPTFSKAFMKSIIFRLDEQEENKHG